MDRLTNSSGTNLDARSAGRSPNRMDAVSHPDSRDTQSPAVYGAWVPTIYAGTMAFWVLLKHHPNRDSLCFNTSQGVPVCIYVQHFYLSNDNNKGRSIKPSCVYFPCKMI